MMKTPRTYLLTWNPKMWPFDDLAAKRNRVTRGLRVADAWSTGNTKRIQPGDRVFLMCLGQEPKGIMASGWCTSHVRSGPHYDDARAAQGDTGLYVDFIYDHLLLPEPSTILRLDLLQNTIHGVVWTPPASGIEIAAEPAQQLEVLWAQHLGLTLERNDTTDYSGVRPQKAPKDRQRKDQSKQVSIIEQVEKYESSLRALPTQENITRSVAARRGQAKFRQMLLQRDGHCVVTRSTCEPILEAAHISPYSSGGSYQLSNGLLLRADIHTLFDLGLIGIEPESKSVHIAAALQGTEYEPFEGFPLRMSAGAVATLDSQALAKRWQDHCVAVKALMKGQLILNGL